MWSWRSWWGRRVISCVRWAVVPGLVLVVGGCITGEQSAPAAPVAPEHTVHNIDAACFRNQLVSYTVNSGFVVHSISEAGISAGRVAHPIGPSLFSTRALEAPEERITLTLIPVAGSGLRVLMSGGYADSAGTGADRITPVALSASDVTAFSGQLDRMAAACPARRSGQ